MNEINFTLELHSEHLRKETEYNLFIEAETRLKQLAKGHTDLIGASVTVRRPSSSQTAPLHEVTIVVYSRPEHIAAAKKETDPQLALKEALDAVERQIRERRNKLRKRWQQPGNLPVEQEIVEVIAAESLNGNNEIRDN